MPRIALDLNNEEDRRKVKGQWRVGPGLVPGQPNEGLAAQLLETPARLADYTCSEVMPTVGAPSLKAAGVLRLPMARRPSPAQVYLPGVF